MQSLKIQGIRKSFNDTHILKGIDIAIEPGEFLILVGPSGCGKSTLLSLIAGLESPTSGSIQLGARDITHLPSKDRDIAMVFQSYALYPNMTVAQNIAFALEMRKLPKPQREAKVSQVAELLQIQYLLDRRPASAWPWAAPWPATRSCSCSTSRSPTSTPSCAWRCAPRSSCCTSARAPPPCM
jgi:multiple sugar transport system ATP-binding protein